MKSQQKFWPQFFETKEPLLIEYTVKALRTKLEDISKELQILYYNKKVKKLWDIFINLQLIETKIIASSSTLSAFSQVSEKTKKDIYPEESVIPL